MAHTCCCTNQCPMCGRCCQFGCAHRNPALQTQTVPSTTTWPPGEITVTPPALTQEDVRRIIRQELERHHGPR